MHGRRDDVHKNVFLVVVVVVGWSGVGKRKEEFILKWRVSLYTVELVGEFEHCRGKLGIRKRTREARISNE